MSKISASIIQNKDLKNGGLGRDGDGREPGFASCLCFRELFIVGTYKGSPLGYRLVAGVIDKTTVYNINVLVSNLITKSKPLTNQNYRINTMNIEKHIKTYYEI